MRLATIWIAVLGLAGAAGCSPEDDGNLPRDTGGGDVGADTDVPWDDCAAGTRLVYVIDEDGTLYSFDPSVRDMTAFREIGPVGCGGQPNSMAVGRDGYAYVLFGEYDVWFGTWSCLSVSRVSLETAACLGPTPFVCDTEGFGKFGMGYATEGPGSTLDTLYVADSIDNRLGTLDVNTGATALVGSLPERGGEFTGNGEGELWGFFPYLEPPAVVQIDKSTGAELRRFTLDGLGSVSTADSAEWAFAYWGHAFYIFYAVTPPDASTNVYRLDYDGTRTTWIPNTGLHIVGAGVSTCAPVVLI